MTHDHVVSVAAQKRVGPTVPVDGVGATIATDDVGAGRAYEPLATGAAGDGATALRQEDRDGVRAGGEHHEVGIGRAAERIIARLAKSLRAPILAPPQDSSLVAAAA